jgi:hypothetical protein
VFSSSCWGVQRSAVSCRDARLNLVILELCCKDGAGSSSASLLICRRCSLPFVPSLNLHLDAPQHRTSSVFVPSSAIPCGAFQVVSFFTPFGPTTWLPRCTIAGRCSHFKYGRQDYLGKWLFPTEEQRTGNLITFNQTEYPSVQAEKWLACRLCT